MSLLTYARKVLDKTRRFFEPIPVDPESDLKKRFRDSLRLYGNSAEIIRMVKTPGWLIIEQVLADSIEFNEKYLTHTNFKTLEEVVRVQERIIAYEEFLQTVDSIDTTYKQAKNEVEELEKTLQAVKGKD